MRVLSSITVPLALGTFALIFSGCDDSSKADSGTASAKPVATAPAQTAPVSAPSVPELRFETARQVAGYGVGYEVGQNLASQIGDDFDRATVLAGFEDALRDKESRLDEGRIQTAFNTLREEKEQANVETSEAFLAENAKRPEVTVTDSGLQYEVLRSSDNPDAERPVPGDKVTVHYEGTLVDGTIFDSSVKRGTPATFPVTGVISGWVEALQLMRVGDKWKLYIPSDLAYGPSGRTKIPPNSALIFEVELLGIEHPEAEKSETPTGGE